MTWTDSEKKVELKPCPFCGGRVLAVWPLKVECLKCETRGPKVVWENGTPIVKELKRQAIEAWNKRADQ